MGRKRVYEIDAETRVCRVCKTEKTVSEFNPNRITKTGYVSIETRCTSCQRARRHAKTAVKKQNDRIAFVGTDDKKMVDRLFKYRLTLEEFEDMIITQKDSCGICQEPLGDQFCIDHCHATGAVRGLLCGPCNRGLGHFRDNVDYLRRASEYLQR